MLKVYTKDSWESTFNHNSFMEIDSLGNIRTVDDEKLLFVFNGPPAGYLDVYRKKIFGYNNEFVARVEEYKYNKDMFSIYSNEYPSRDEIPLCVIDSITGEIYHTDRFGNVDKRMYFGKVTTYNPDTFRETDGFKVQEGEIYHPERIHVKENNTSHFKLDSSEDKKHGILEKVGEFLLFLTFLIPVQTFIDEGFLPIICIALASIFTAFLIPNTVHLMLKIAAADLVSALVFCIVMGTGDAILVGIFASLLISCIRCGISKSMDIDITKLINSNGNEQSEKGRPSTITNETKSKENTFYANKDSNLKAESNATKNENIFKTSVSETKEIEKTKTKENVSNTQTGYISSSENNKNTLKFCPKCGNRIVPGTKFCTKCGLNVELLKTKDVE